MLEFSCRCDIFQSRIFQRIKYGYISEEMMMKKRGARGKSN